MKKFYNYTIKAQTSDGLLEFGAEFWSASLNKEGDLEFRFKIYEDDVEKMYQKDPHELISIIKDSWKT